MSNRTVIDAGLDRRARSDNVLTLAWEEQAYRRVPMARLLEFDVLGTGLDRRARSTSMVASRKESVDGRSHD